MQACMLNWSYCLHAQNIHGNLFIYFLISVTYVSLLLKPLNAEDLSLRPFVAGSLHASAFRAEFTELTARSCGASIGPDICVCTTAAAATTHCQRALTRCWCGNGRNNELLQGYLCVSPCHDCVSCSANLIRRDKLLKMFSDFFHLLLLCPQIDFGSGCWEEIISGFSSCRDVVGEVCKYRLCENFTNIWILIFHL